MSEFIKKISKLKNDPILDSIVSSKIASIKRANINSEEEYKRFLILKRAAKNLNIDNLENIAELITYKISNLNDAYYWILKTKLNHLKKVAYPNYQQQYYYDNVQFDLNRWMDLAHKIYDAVQSNSMTKEAAIDFYSKILDLDNEEDFSFKRWFNYYAAGEHKKYSNKRGEDMKKNAVYMSNTMNIGSYPHSGGSFYRSQTSPGFNLPGSSLEPSEEEVSEKAGKKVNLKDWKSRLLSRIRGIQKLMVAEEYVDPDTFDSISKTLNDLANQVYKVRLESTASDLTSKAANSLVKIGAFTEARELRKIAQEVTPEAEGAAASPTPAPTPTNAPTAPGGTPAAPAGEAAAQPPAEAGPTAGIPKSNEVEPVAFEDIKPFPGAKQGEYEELAGDISIGNAAAKLDEVAGMLADRRIIRLLAEFDIMLDKIGIASMFPELAESQSKLIDAFSYALTRVTKMMGQLSNAQTVINSTGSLPGTIPNKESAAPASSEETSDQE